MSRLKDSVVVITGASSGIGRAAALKFAKKGAKVVLASRNAPALEEVAAEIAAAGGTALVVPTDTTVEEQVFTLAGRAIDAYGRIDVWVNNAAAYMMGRIEDVPAQEQARLFEVNVMGYIHGIRAVMPHFRARGKGVIVQTGSIAGKAPYALAGTYCATKHAVRALSDTLRQETKGSGIRVATVVPATIDTPLFQHAANYTGKAMKAMKPVYSARRVARAIVSAAAFPRREVVVGLMPRFNAFMRVVVPWLQELLFPKQIRKGHLDERIAAPRKQGNLYAPKQPEQASGGWKTDPEPVV